MSARAGSIRKRDDNLKKYPVTKGAGKLAQNRIDEISGRAFAGSGLVCEEKLVRKCLCPDLGESKEDDANPESPKRQAIH